MFSTKIDAPSDVPLSVLTDHTFGVSAVAFSHDSRWLCTLGNTYDGFIFVYSINPKTGLASLHSSNKCSNVNSVTWMGSSVLTIGTRHARIWRIEQNAPKTPSKMRHNIDSKPAASPISSTPKAFLGRNCILGPLIDSTFSHSVSISHGKAILCSLQGDVCLLDDTSKTQQIKSVAKMDFCIFCVTLDQRNNSVLVAGESGEMRSIPLSDPTNSAASTGCKAPSSPPGQNVKSNLRKRPDILAIGILRDRVVTLSSDRQIRITETLETSALPLTVKSLPAHEDAVIGVHSLLPKAKFDSPDFLTFSAKGSVRFWMLDGSCTGSLEITLDQSSLIEDTERNELRTLASFLPDEIMISGDRYGVLR